VIKQTPSPPSQFSDISVLNGLSEKMANLLLSFATQCSRFELFASALGWAFSISRPVGQSSGMTRMMRFGHAIRSATKGRESVGAVTETAVATTSPSATCRVPEIDFSFDATKFAAIAQVPLCERGK
jgi:hypothetical protein